MPDQISVSEFVAETHEDYKAPTASSFTTRTAQCRNTVAAIEEVSGSLGGAGREARAAGIALRPGDPLGFRAWCPMPSARHLRPHPGKVSGPPEPDAAGPAVPNTEALCSLRGGSGERLLGHLGPFLGTLLSAPISLAGFQVLCSQPRRGQLQLQSPWLLRAGDPCELCGPGVMGLPAQTSPTCSRSGPAGAAVRSEPTSSADPGDPEAA